MSSLSCHFYLHLSRRASVPVLVSSPFTAYQCPSFFIRASIPPPSILPYLLAPVYLSSILLCPIFSEIFLCHEISSYTFDSKTTPEPRPNSPFYSVGYPVQNRSKTSTFPIEMTYIIAGFHRASRSSHSAIFIRREKRYSVPPSPVCRSGTRGNRKLQVNEPYAVTRFSLGRVLQAAGPLVRGPLRSLSRDTRVFPCWIQPSSLPYTSAEGRRNRVRERERERERERGSAIVLIPSYV